MGGPCLIQYAMLTILALELAAGVWSIALCLFTLFYNFFLVFSTNLTLQLCMMIGMLSTVMIPVVAFVSMFGASQSQTKTQN